MFNMPDGMALMCMKSSVKGFKVFRLPDVMVLKYAV